MNFRKERLLYHLLTIIIAIGAFTGASYAQSVTIGGVNPSGTPLPNPTVTPAPSGSFDVVATPSATPTSVVFYRNDIPIATDTTSPYKITQDQLAQDTYTYHARAYFSGGVVAESGDFKISVTTKRYIKMGAPPARGEPTTTGPDGDYDHTEEIQAAVDFLGDHGGGTLFFPCTLLEADQAKYNIRATIDIPSGVTLQGESSEWWGRCRIYWLDVDLETYGNAKDDCNSLEDGAPEDQRNRPMFRVNGGKSGVRFRDLAIFSRASGPLCGYVRPDFDNIAAEETAGIELNTGDPYCGGSCSEDPGGDIKDVIFENVGIYDFTYGIRAVSNITSEHEISGVKIRGYRAQSNHRQLYIDAPFAYDWDVQNLNISSMAEHQGGVEIKKAGAPSSYTGTRGNLKFLQLNCAGDRAYPPAFCVQVTKHGGLYFRQLHHEGADRAITVLESSEENEQPIVMESGLASGQFEDGSMKLYLIGNGIVAPEKEHPYLDDVHMRFEGDGLNSTIVDCGDLDGDWTDIDGGTADPDDFKMLFTHTERYRGGFFAKKDTGNKMPHKYCPSASPNISEIGGEFFDSGVLPHEEPLYSNVFDGSTCSTECDIAYEITTRFAYGGSVYIDGQFDVESTITIPRGMQIIGAPGAELTMVTSGLPLFKIEIPPLSSDAFGSSAIVIRNLKLSGIQSGTTGIDMVGEDTADVGVGRDIHFSGLTIEGFTTGIKGRPHTSHPTKHPMIDGVGMKNMTFVNNATAVSLTSGNASNWNVMDLRMQSNSSNAVGWSQTSGGHQGLQDVRCVGNSTAMRDCIFVQYSGAFYINGLRQTQNVTNAVTLGESGLVNDPPYQARHFSNMVIRNSDLTSASSGMGVMNVVGKSFITSMNNKYDTFSIGSTHGGTVSRVTYCGDTYVGGTAYLGLDALHDNLWVGLQTPTSIQCGSRPIPYDNAVRWTEDWDDDESVGTPLVGNFFDNTKEDFVVYVAGSSSKFLIQQRDRDGRMDIPWGSSTHNDIPLTGNFFPASGRSQIVVYRPKTSPTSSEWWVLDPSTCTFTTTPPSSCTTYTWSWGSGTLNDIPFTGNFFDESGGAITGNMDEIGIYRPGTNDFYITNPRSGAYVVLAPANSSGSEIQVGDFLGKGYDQVAQYDSSNGNWYITDPRSPYGEYTSNVTGVTETTGDIPVAGKYQATLSGKDPCIQVGIWRPSNQTFYIAEVNPTPYGGASARNCGTRDANMVWGLNNGAYPDDIPLTINTADGSLRRPTAYRRTKGAYDHGIGDGQWWVHDPF